MKVIRPTYCLSTSIRMHRKYCRYKFHSWVQGLTKNLHHFLLTDHWLLVLNKDTNFTRSTILNNLNKFMNTVSIWNDFLCVFVTSVHSLGGEEICVVERLFSSSLVALVSLSSPRKLKVCHYKKAIDICNESFSSSILAVKLNRQRLVVCLEQSVHIYNIRDMKMIHIIRETPPNPLGLCALSSNSENGFLAYPGHNTAGEVQIFDTDNLVNKITFAAHDNPLAALAFDPSGTRLATASEKVILSFFHFLAIFLSFFHFLAIFLSFFHSLTQLFFGSFLSFFHSLTQLFFGSSIL